MTGNNTPFSNYHNSLAKFTLRSAMRQVNTSDEKSKSLFFFLIHRSANCLKIDYEGK